MILERWFDNLRKNVLSALSDMGCFGSLVLSVQDIECYMNIILIVISIFILCVNFGLRVWDRVKDGKLTKEEIQDTIDDAEKLKDDISKMKRGE